MDYSPEHEECRDLGSNRGNGRIVNSRLCAKRDTIVRFETRVSYTPTSLHGIEVATVSDRTGRFLRELRTETNGQRIGECKK